MNNKIWKKRDGKEMTEMVESLDKAQVTGTEINGNNLAVVYLTLVCSRRPDDQIQLKLQKGDYTSDFCLYEHQRPRIGLAEVDLVNERTNKTVLAFRILVDSSDMMIENRKNIDDEIEKALKDQIKLECARQLKKLIATLPEMVDEEQFLSDIRSNCEVKIVARLQNGINIPMDVNELSTRTMRVHEVLDRAKEAEISFSRKASAPHDSNNLPF